MAWLENKTFLWRAFGESHGVVKCFWNPCQQIDLLKLWDFFAFTWKWKDIEIFCRINLLSQWNITVDEQLLPCKTCCKFIQYMANKPDKFFPKVLACSWCRKQILIQRLSLCRKRRYKKQWHACAHRCCAEAHGSAFPMGLQFRVWQLFYLTWSCFETSREKVQSCWDIVPEWKSQRNATRKRNCMKPKCLGMMAKRQSHTYLTSEKQQKNVAVMSS